MNTKSVYNLKADELELVRLAVDLGAETVGGTPSEAERHLIEQARAVSPPPQSVLDGARAAIQAGEDPLGSEFCRIRSATERRSTGAFYTSSTIIDPMLDWVLHQRPDRLIDPGCGSGRFAVGAIRRRPDLTVVAIDIDPVATLLTRAQLACVGGWNALVIQADYTRIELPRFGGRTAFIGNPPYVRHHDLPLDSKAWAVSVAKSLGYSLSALAGLHVHFYLATALMAQPGDIGCFVTSAEWLDVNYGGIVRDLLLDGLGGQALHLVDPRSVPFQDAMTTAVIACFAVGNEPSSMRLQLVKTPLDLRDLNAGTPIDREALSRTKRWTRLISDRPAMDNIGQVPLRAIARVHRGIVTGANNFFILQRDRAQALGLEEWCRPAITSADEILKSDGIVRNRPDRLLLLDIPANIDRRAYPAIDAYLRRGEEPWGADAPIAERYIPRHRRPWWYLGRHEPPPIVASYMARQAPVFALNPEGLAIVNVAHGIYPLFPLTSEQLTALVKALNERRDSYRGHGRTYHGGLEKFEPREMESLLVPPIGALC